MSDISQSLQQQVKIAHAEQQALMITSGNSKGFYGRNVSGKALAVQEHRGILNYEPTELVLTARAGTPLQAIEQTLEDNQQMLAFEPPHYDPGATIGGTIACNFSGPRRAYAGAARDYLLGTKIINGKGDILQFGGEVMKNVAGYDVSRLMAGAMGTLGVLLEVSLKVLPKPALEHTLAMEMSSGDAFTQMQTLATKPIPLSATAYHEGKLYVRLSGATQAVNAAVKTLPGELMTDAKPFWHDLREHKLDFFNNAHSIWRLSLPPTAQQPDISGNWLIEWGGGLRWLVSDETPENIFSAARCLGGHACLFRSQHSGDNVFQPLADNISVIHQRLKQAFDPQKILNPGKLYPEI